MLLMIDNYDSFTYNVVQYLASMGQDVKVYKNDQISVNQIQTLSPKYIVISPGPCTPNEAGISMEVIKQFAGKIPLLGICLGHQCIAQVFGGKVVRAHQVMHGKVSAINHNNRGIFQSLPNPMRVTRYHSLIVENESLPSSFDVTAWFNRDDKNSREIMGLRHSEYALEGVQFHPESIMTQAGHQLLANFLNR